MIMASKAFDIGEAIFFFFKRFGEKPAAAMWIALWHLLLLSAATAGALWLFLPFINEIIAMESRPVGPSDAEILRAVGRVMMSVPLMVIVGVLVSLMVHGAWYRYLARDEVSAVIPVRIGGDEIRLAGVAILFFGLLVIAEIVASAVFAMVGLTSFGFMAMVDGDTSAVVSGGILLLLLGLAYMAAQIFVSVRLSPAAGLTFVDRKFRFFEAWDASSGQFWKMLLSYIVVGIGIYLIIMVVAVIFGFALLGSILPVIGELQAIEDMNATPAETMAALRDVFFRAEIMLPLGIATVIAALVEILIMGMWAGVGVYTARLYRENHPVESGDAPTLTDDHPAGASPSEG